MSDEWRKEYKVQRQYCKRCNSRLVMRRMRHIYLSIVDRKVYLCESCYQNYSTLPNRGVDKHGVLCELPQVFDDKKFEDIEREIAQRAKLNSE